MKYLQMFKDFQDEVENHCNKKINGLWFYHMGFIWVTSVTRKINELWFIIKGFIWVASLAKHLDLQFPKHHRSMECLRFVIKPCWHGWIKGVIYKTAIMF